MNACNIMDELNEKELSHVIRYKDTFYRLSEEEQDVALQDAELTEEYLLDFDAEEKFTKDMRREKGSHLSNCTHENCNKIRDVWTDNIWLKRYIVTQEKLLNGDDV